METIKEVEERYQIWINENIKNPLNACEKATLDMNKSFPELHRVRGHYNDPFTGKRPHWWLKTKDGAIVDPTFHQFNGPQLVIFYEEHDESQPEPTGKCPNCGKYCYNNNSVCSKKCEKEYLTYLNGDN